MRWQRHLTGMAALIVPVPALVTAAEDAGTRDYGSVGYGSTSPSIPRHLFHPDP
jgi:hypothetical protein